MRRKKIFYCTNCKKIIYDIEKLLLVEQGRCNCFCSENCIVEFHAPLLEYMEREEHSLRAEMNLLDEPALAYKNEEEFFKQTMGKPDKVWLDKNELGEEFYYFQSQFTPDGEAPLTKILVCYLFNGAPSFVLFQTCTRSKELIKEYQTGERIKNFLEYQKDQKIVAENENFEELPMEPQLIELIEQKRSHFLALLLEKRLPTDIPLESFGLYESYLPKTLEGPDEVYQYKDDDGEEIYTYIRSFEKDGISFFYLAVCLHVSTDMEKDEDVLVPILTFPSLDGELYADYKKGEQLTGSLKN